MRALGLLMVLVGATAAGTVQAADKHVVIVVDPAGKPVVGARVEPISPSINGVPVMTDRKGEAVVPRFIGQATAWICVSKPGFETTPHLRLPAKWPWKIVLKPGKSGPPPSVF